MHYNRDSRYLLTIPAFGYAGIIRHAFTTRKNGLGGRRSGIKAPGDWTAVAEAFGIGPDRVVTVNQVHGEEIARVDEGNFRDIKTVSADALITNARGIAIGVETADCVPVLLFDPALPAVGAVHAGWRGTVRQLVPKTVAAMRDQFGADPAGIVAAIGPAIGPECYEIDEPVMGPVRQAFSFWKEVATARGRDRWSLDLVKANRRVLAESGLRPENIHSLGLCTSCRRDLFYSFRAEGRTGRMLSAVMIQPCR